MVKLQLENTRKEPLEILDAYGSCMLELSGNATHLAPWYTKLGFQAEPFIATLSSLSPDGGHVPFMHLVVEKVFPQQKLPENKLIACNRCMVSASSNMCKSQVKIVEAEPLALAMKLMRRLNTKSGK